PVSSVLARYWKRAFNLYSQYDGQTLYDEWFKVFAPKGRAPYAGELWHSPDHALTLKLIAQTQGEAFYKGEIAQKIDEFSKQTAGYIRLQDLADYEAQWVEPIKVNYRGYDVWEIPPNSQGIIALQALNILKGFEFKEKECLDTYHTQIEAVKLAFTDALNHVTEPQHMVYQVEQMLSEEYAQTRRALIKDEAVLPVVGEPFGGGTVYLATADKEGNMVSFIQSNYRGFG